MFTYDFMQNAFAAAGIVAVVSGLVGFFLVLRAQTFAGHALSHVGFAGATGAVLIGVSPLWGLIVLTRRGRGRNGIARRAVISARCGDRHRAGDVARARACCSCISSRPTRRRQRRCCSATSSGWMRRRSGRCCCLASLPLLLRLARSARPLLFASLQPELAEAKGVSLRLVSVLFLAIVAVGRRGVRADRRRAAGVRTDGGAGRGGATTYHAVLARHHAVGGCWRWRRRGWGWCWRIGRIGRPASGLRC